VITRKEYERIPDREWRGVRVRVLRDLQNGFIHVEAGASGTITRKFSGFELTIDACPRCRVGAVVTRVSPSYLQRIIGGD